MVCRIQYKDCHAQDNDYNCRIFAVVVVFHLAKFKALNSDAFSQDDVF